MRKKPKTLSASQLRILIKESIRPNYTGHDVKNTRAYLEKASRALGPLSDLESALGQVSSFSEIPGAKQFAYELSKQCYKISKLIEDYLDNNDELKREPPTINEEF